MRSRSTPPTSGSRSSRAADVAKDAADIVLLEKDLGVLADGVTEGRRTFANTIKYVLMGTSSNFGNMFSAAVASTFLSFLPMLPSQILLNNLLYDSSQMAIPTDLVDPKLLTRPSHWDIAFIRRFMLTFGPISSIFDFATFAIMLGPFAAGPALFRSGWFVESLATQTLVVFVIRTHRVPFWRSRPSRPLLFAVIGVITIGALLPYSPFAHDLGFTALPADFFAVLAGMVVLYLFLVEARETPLLRTRPRTRPSTTPTRTPTRTPTPPPRITLDPPPNTSTRRRSRSRARPRRAARKRTTPRRWSYLAGTIELSSRVRSGASQERACFSREFEVLA